MELSINSDINRPLHQALVTHVIPQLLDTTSRVYEKIPFSSIHSEELGKACVTADGSQVEVYVKSMLMQGHDIESLYLDAIPQAAGFFTTGGRRMTLTLFKSPKAFSGWSN